MSTNGSPNDPAKGLRRIAVGALVGLAAGILGLALPFGLYFLAAYSPGTLLLSPALLLQVTAVLALVGAILLAISLTVYRLGFASLRALDPRFWAASVLCMIGTIGILLLILPMALAFTASDAMASCIQGAPTKALTCLRSAAPLASYVGLLGFWLLWLGGLGVVVGIGLASVRYREGWLSAGATLYAFLLLGLLAPALALLFPIDGLVYPILALPLLVFLAPAVTSHGTNQALRSSG